MFPIPPPDTHPSSCLSFYSVLKALQLDSIMTRWLGSYTSKTAFWWMEVPDTHQALEMAYLRHR